MKILLRNYNGNRYVWKDAKWDGIYKLLDTNEGFYETRILAVQDDDRAGYVKCANCGELVKNDPESIEQHYAKLEAKKDCLNCDKLVVYGDRYGNTRSVEDTGAGYYKVAETYVTRLGCKMGYYTEDIHSSSAKRNCKYAKCRRFGVKEICDAFVKYPGLFEKQITVDMLTSKKYAFDKTMDGFHRYDLKMYDTVKACVNDLGIVDHFIVVSKGWAYKFYYSDKYKKLFFEDYNSYNENVTDWITQSKADKIIEKLSKLYEEANADEQK